MEHITHAMYLRKSRADDQSLSVEEVLQRHRALLWDMVDRMHIPRAQVELYEEVVSGESILARPRMLELLPRVEAGAYQGVFAADMQRLGRGDMMEQGMILNAFRRSSTLIYTPAKTYNLADDSDETLASIQALFSRMEYKAIKTRMRRGLLATVQDGGYVANAPYGYRQARIDRMPTLEIVEEEAVFIRHIYSRYLSGVGSTSISRELNAMGSVPHRRPYWDRNSVRVVLRNPVYCGKIAYNRVHRERLPDGRFKAKYMPADTWLLVDGRHPAIISEADWQRAQEIRAAKDIHPHYTGEVKSPLAGLVYCAVCGRHMQRMAGHTKVPYLLCNTKGCVAGAKMEYVEPVLLDSLRRRLDRLKEEIRASADLDTSAQRRELEMLEKEIARQQARIPRLMDMVEDGTYTREEYRSRRAAVDDQVKQLEQRREAVRQTIRQMSADEKIAAAKKLENILALYPTSDAETRNRLLKSVITRIDYTKDKKTRPRDFDLKITARDFLW